MGTVADRNGTLEFARRYLHAGISVCPVKTDGSKAAKGSWKQLQTTRLEQHELDTQFGRNGRSGVAVIFGGVSGDMEAIDVDEGAIKDEFESAVNRLSPGLVEKLSKVQTPRDGGGWQYWYRCLGRIEGNQKLAWSEARPLFNDDETPLLDPTSGEHVHRPEVMIGTRGEDGYCIAVGSPGACHPTGRTYQHVGGPPPWDPPTITPAERMALLEAAKSLDCSDDKESGEHKDVFHYQRDNYHQNGQDVRPGDLFNQRATWAEILEPHGWKNIGKERDLTLWRRPGKTGTGSSAKTGLKSKEGNDLLCVHSTNAHPFESYDAGKKTYSKFAAFTLLNHNGDFTAATRAIVAKGYEPQPRKPKPINKADEHRATPKRIRNYTLEKSVGDDKWVAVPLAMGDIIDELHRQTDNWPRRIQNVLFVDDPQHGIDWFDRRTTAGLFGWLKRHFDVEWRSGGGFVSKAELFAELERTAMKHKAIELLPHEPQLPGHYYSCKIPPLGDGSTLTQLLNRFRPKTPIDRDLIQSAFMTPFWGGPPSTRPAYVITSDEGRGAGKTKLGECISYLSGGCIDVSAGEDIDIIKQRLLSPEGQTKRIAFLDNVKSLRFSWAELEALITTPVISGKRMYVGEGQRPNTITWLITLNGPSLSTDMAQRSVIIKLAKGTNNARWYEETIQFLDDNREKLIGDIITALPAEPFPLAKYSRWATWEAAVLSRLPEPGEAQRVILERQQEVNSELDEAEIIEDHFAEQLRRFRYDPVTECVRIPVETVARWMGWAMGEDIKTPTATKRLKLMASEDQLKRLKQDPSRSFGRCWIWYGDDADRVETSIHNDLALRIGTNLGR